MMLFSHQIVTFAKRDIGTRAPMTAAALGVVVLLAFGGVAGAENECGAPEPDVELTCSPSNYDSAEDGNIFYGPDESNGDFTIRLTDDLVLDYDREAPGDDFYSLPGDPESRLYSAVWITPTETGDGYTGDISVFSSADVTSNARGISVGHYGESGALRMELTGGNFTTMGERARGIHSYYEGAGNVDIIARNLAVNTDGSLAEAIISSHAGQGSLDIDVRDSVISTEGDNAEGILGQHLGQGSLDIHVQGGAISTTGENARGIFGGHFDAGDVTINAQDLTVSAVGENADGIRGQHTGQGSLDIDVRDSVISTEGDNADGILGQHAGQGSLDIHVQGGDISTTGENAYGIFGGHFDAGDVTINAQDLTVSATGENADGIRGQHTGQGSLDIHVQGGAISTTGENARGIFGGHFDAGDVTINAQDLTVSAMGEGAAGIFGGHFGTGDIDIDVQGGAITTDGAENNGLAALHLGTGNIDIDVQGGDIAVKGESASGIDSRHRGTGDISIIARNITINTNGLLYANAILSSRVGAGDINIDVRDATFMVTGDSSDGIFASHRGEKGDITVDAQGLTIAVNGTKSNGVYGDHRGAEGDVNIDVRGGRITTRGVNSYGIYARHTNPTDDDDNPLTDSENNVIQGTGDITVGMTGGEISTQGDGSHGVYAEHESGIGEIRITVDGGTIRAGGMDASGIQVGYIDQGQVQQAAGVGEDGYRKQSVTVNGRVWGGTGEAAGVYLAGGGRVMIGPEGSLGAESGVAIRATGATLDAAVATRKPKLYVDANLAGRRMASVIQGDIRNDGGETTFLINGVTLHDGVTGATGIEVLNGAWDVTLRAGKPLADRAFSANDVVEVYAPRAAVYEALPGLLLRLNSRGPAGERLTAPGSPAWVRVAGGAGRYAAAQASVGAKYDFHRIEVEAGLDVVLGKRLTGSLSVRHVQGSGDVSSPTGGGEINARGLGGAIGIAWAGPRGYYFQGRVSVIDYDVDLASDTRGTLTEDASALGHSLGFETGRRFTLSERITLTPRVWVTRSKISLGFTDAVQSRLSTKDSDRLTAGTGLVAETERIWDDGAQAFAVRGSLDLWRTLGDGTALKVSQGEPLKSVSDKTRVLVGLAAVYRWGRFSVRSEVAAGGLGSRDQEYAGYLNLGIQF